MKQQTKAADDWVALVFYQEKEVYYVGNNRNRGYWLCNLLSFRK